MLKTVLILIGLVTLFTVLGIAAQRHCDKMMNEPPCKKDDCKTCPFPPCNEEERKSHTGEE